MTRLETIAALLLELGPSTTREIAARMGIENMSSASALMSHASAYGYAKLVGQRPVNENNQGGRINIWGPRAAIIRQPSASRVRA